MEIKTNFDLISDSKEGVPFVEFKRVCFKKHIEEMMDHLDENDTVRDKKSIEHWSTSDRLLMKTWLKQFLDSSWEVRYSPLEQIKLSQNGFPWSSNKEFLGNLRTTIASEFVYFWSQFLELEVPVEYLKLEKWLKALEKSAKTENQEAMKSAGQEIKNIINRIGNADSECIILKNSQALAWFKKVVKWEKKGFLNKGQSATILKESGSCIGLCWTIVEKVQRMECSTRWEVCSAEKDAARVLQSSLNPTVFQEKNKAISECLKAWDQNPKIKKLFEELYKKVTAQIVSTEECDEEFLQSFEKMIHCAVGQFAGRKNALENRIKVQNVKMHEDCEEDLTSSTQNQDYFGFKEAYVLWNEAEKKFYQKSTNGAKNLANASTFSNVALLVKTCSRYLMRGDWTVVKINMDLKGTIENSKNWSSALAESAATIDQWMSGLERKQLHEMLSAQENQESPEQRLVRLRQEVHDLELEVERQKAQSESNLGTKNGKSLGLRRL